MTLVLAASTLEAARSQMAFTLGFHIILASLGVALPAIMLIANYRGIKRDDHDALVLAQRWSKYMAVTFAVGAVTGTVLSFEFGLLWPRFMGIYGDAFGIPFAFIVKPAGALIHAFAATTEIEPKTPAITIGTPVQKCVHGFSRRQPKM